MAHYPAISGTTLIVQTCLWLRASKVMLGDTEVFFKGCGVEQQNIGVQHTYRARRRWRYGGAHKKASCASLVRGTNP